MKMKYILSAVLSVFISLSLFAQKNEQDEIIFKAMQDELQRTREQLHLQGTPPPFYVSYTVGRTHRFGVVSSLGAIITSLHTPWAMQGAVQMFIGDRHRNTNVMEQTMPVSLPVEIDYNGIRRGFWLASDMMYKMSLQVLMKKMEYLKSNPLTPEEEALDDWSSLPAVQHHENRSKEIHVDLPAFEKMVNELSAIFLKYKELYNTNVSLVGSETDIYKLTSEGTSLKFPLSLTTLRVSAEVRTPEETPISDILSIEVQTPADLPSIDELKKQVTAFAENLLKLKDAPVMEEFYSGPVMFESGAVATLFSEILLQKGALLAQRDFVASNNRGLSDRFGHQILDKRLSIKNYTTLESYNGKVLNGRYKFDAEGVTSKSELTLVDCGLFKAMLNGRTPAFHALTSTGSARLPEMATEFTCLTAPGTIHVQVNKGSKPAKMKANFLKEAKAQGLKYAYIVRSIAGSTSQIYRVDVKTGEETQERSAGIQAISISKLMNLKEISSEERVDNILWKGACFSSMIYPSAITMSNLEIRKVPVKPEKTPELKYPLQR